MRAFNRLWRAGEIALGFVSVGHIGRGVIVEVNTAFSTLLGYGVGELSGEQSTEILASGDQLRWSEDLGRLISGEIDRISQVNRWVMRGRREYLTCHTWAWTLKDEDDNPTAVMVHIRPVPEVESERAKAEHDEMVHQMESFAHELRTIKGQLALLSAGGDRDRDVVVNVGDRVGDNTSTKNDLGPFKWLVLGLVIVVLGIAWAEYYTHGGKEKPPELPKLEGVE